MTLSRLISVSQVYHQWERDEGGFRSCSRLSVLPALSKTWTFVQGFGLQNVWDVTCKRESLLFSYLLLWFLYLCVKSLCVYMNLCVHGCLSLCVIVCVFKLICSLGCWMWVWVLWLRVASVTETTTMNKLAHTHSLSLHSHTAMNILPLTHIHS